MLPEYKEAQHIHSNIYVIKGNLSVPPLPSAPISAKIKL